MDTSRFKFKSGDEVEVVSLREDLDESSFFDIGFSGRIKDFRIEDGVEGNNLLYDVERNGEFDRWWVSEDSLELVNGVTQRLPEKKRGFKKISIEQWLIDGFSTNRFDGDNGTDLLTLLYNDIKLPKRGTKHSGGYDVFAPFEITLQPNESIKVPTGIKAYMLEDEVVYGHVRSSMGFKYALRLMNTTAIGDSDYFDNENNEGHYWLAIRNEGDKVVHIEKGEAFAQFVFHKYLITDDDSFDEGETRVGGIGSTNSN